MFVDASVIVVILTGETDADSLADRLQLAAAPVTSPIALFEAVAGMCRKCRLSAEEAYAGVLQFVEAARIAIVPITAEELDVAVTAYSRYGKGQGHPAQLNLGDCFAYASAKVNRVPLLFKGDDYTKTDING